MDSQEAYRQLRQKLERFFRLNPDLTVAEAQELYSSWMIDQPSTEEAEVFRRVLYDPEEVGKQTRRGRRSASISLILEILGQQADPVSVDHIRRAMTINDLPTRLGPEKRETLAGVQGIWRVLQLRQAQRLAAETLFGWLEIQVLGMGRNLSSHIVDDLFNVIKTEEGGHPPGPDSGPGRG